MFFSLRLMIIKLFIRKAYMYIVHANNYCFSDVTFRIDYSNQWFYNVYASRFYTILFRKIKTNLKFRD